MAIMKCANCGKDVSTKAKNCPHCNSKIYIDKEDNSIKQVLQELNIKCKITILITIVLLVLSITCICKGFDHKENYYQSDTHYTLNKHVYVGGDAYNYIINSNYFTGYMTLGGSLLIASLICAKTTIEMIKERN